MCLLSISNCARGCVSGGDKVVIIEENGRVIIENAAIIALKTAQDAFAGEAERLGIKTEQDVVDLVKEVRRAVWRNAMRIMLDTNVLVSALLFSGQKTNVLIERVTTDHQLVLSSYTVDELFDVTRRKFPDEVEMVDTLLSQLPYEHVVPLIFEYEPSHQHQSRTISSKIGLKYKYYLNNFRYNQLLPY
jgi:predicted nucleic acid-binding protein